MLLYKENIKILTIAKKKQFSRTTVFLWNRFILFNKQAFFDFKNEIIISICLDGQIFRGCNVIAI